MNPIRNAITALSAMLAILLLSGCQSAPTAFDEALWDLTTNYVEVVQTRTNVVTITQTNLVHVTNLVEVLPDVFLPQIVTTPMVSITTNTYVSIATNLAPVIEAKADPELVGTAKTIGGMFGVGEMAGAIATGLLGIIGAWRFQGKKVAKSEIVSGNLVTAIEALREVIKTKEGAEADAMIKAFLMKNQVQAGVFEEVVKLLDTKLDGTAANQVSDQILKFLAEKKNESA
jgi:hypothetical protein